MKKLYKLNSKPTLREPNLLAAWPGISGVASIVASYLLRKLPFKDLAEINDPYFFDPIGILVKNGIVESPQFPKGRFYYYKNKEEKPDLIIFTGDDQPQNKTHELAHTIIDLAERFNVKTIYTSAAALTRIHHSEHPKVWAAATSEKVSEDISKYGVTVGENLQISGLNGLLLGVAKERNQEGLCLLGEVPTYFSRMPNPIAALSIVKTLAKMLEIEVDTFELAQQASEVKEKMKQMASEAMEEYIDYFTEPIWEKDDEGNYGNDQ